MADPNTNVNVPPGAQQGGQPAQNQPQAAPIDFNALANAIPQGVVQAFQQQPVQQPQPAPPVPPPPAPVVFARAPALTNTSSITLIDYSITSGAKLFNKATEHLPSTISLKAPNLPVLLDELSVKADTFRWDSILRISIFTPPTQPGALAPPAAVTAHLIRQNGQITQAKVNDYARTFIDTQSRKAQLDWQLYLCMTNSIDPESKAILAGESSSYKLGGDQWRYRNRGYHLFPEKRNRHRRYYLPGDHAYLS